MVERGYRLRVGKATGGGGLVGVRMWGGCAQNWLMRAGEEGTEKK